MEKPDAGGFVNISWPSTNVPHGGIFHARIAQPSEDQQKFLKVLLEESKLSLELRRKSAFGLRGDADGKKARTGAGSAAAPMRPCPRPQTSRRRSLSAIRCSGVLDVDTYRPPKRGEDRERMKERLANAMAFGDAPEQAAPPPPRPHKPTPKLPTTKETWNELVTQIRERAEWLAEMESLGAAAAHRDSVQQQIAERMRALDALGLDSARDSVRDSVRDSARDSVRDSALVAVRDTPSASSGASLKRDDKTRRGPSGRRGQPAVESVAAYARLPAPPVVLAYSPRRRV